jgi:hypothetical protein
LFTATEAAVHLGHPHKFKALNTLLCRLPSLSVTSYVSCRETEQAFCGRLQFLLGYPGA